MSVWAVSDGVECEREENTDESIGHGRCKSFVFANERWKCLDSSSLIHANPSAFGGISAINCHLYHQTYGKWVFRLACWTCNQLVATPVLSATLGKLLTHMCLCHQAVSFGISLWAVMPCGSNCNRRSGVALAMRHRPPTGSRSGRGRWAPAYALLVEYDELYLYRSTYYRSWRRSHWL